MARLRRSRVERSKSKKLVNLAAADGGAIRVERDAKLEFVRRDKKCSMKFMGADVEKSLGTSGVRFDGLVR